MSATNNQGLRPAFHFTPKKNWMNDPNGLVFNQGFWHLYFQYNPEGASWGNMSWGHATSADLRTWTEHPVALSYRDGEQIFSGSIVATPAGTGTVLTAFYTSAYDNDHQAQSRATSQDGGYTWEFDATNPVLDRGTSAFRDPKVIRVTDEQGEASWVMLTVEADDRQVLFFSSRDLRSWEYLSSFGPLGDSDVVWECPDLVPFSVDGILRWVLLLSTNPVGENPNPDGSSMSYIIGQFDGTTFRADAAQLTRLDHGRDFYAGVTFDSAPGGGVLLGWMSNWRYADVFPSSPWRGAMSLPRRLSLRQVAGKMLLVQEPPSFVREQLADAATTSHDSARPLDLILSGHALVELAWDPASTGALRIQLRGDADAYVEVSHEPASNVLTITRGGAAMAAVHADFPSTSTVALPGDGTGAMTLLLSLDGPLLEAFINRGEVAASNLVLLGVGPVQATIATARQGPITVTVADLGDAKDSVGPVLVAAAG